MDRYKSSSSEPHFCCNSCKCSPYIAAYSFFLSFIDHIFILHYLLDTCRTSLKMQIKTLKLISTKMRSWSMLEIYGTIGVETWIGILLIQQGICGMLLRTVLKRSQNLIGSGLSRNISIPRSSWYVFIMSLILQYLVWFTCDTLWLHLAM